MKFNLFCGGIKQTKPTKEIVIEQFCEILTDKNLSAKIENIKNCQDKENKNKLKSFLDYVTFAGTFEKRGDDKIKTMSGLICLDFDDIDNPDLIKELVMQKDKYVNLAFVSPSGKGLKVIIKHPKSIKTKEEYNLIVKNAYIYFQNKYNLKGDEGTHDLSRACYVSYDTKYIYKEKSSVFDKIDLKEPIKKKKKYVDEKPKRKKDIFFTELLENKIQYIEELKKSDGKNAVLLKNLAAFVCWDNDLIDSSVEFIKNFGEEKENKLKSWIKKSKKDKLRYNYFELIQWSKEYKLEKLLKLLNKQIDSYRREYSIEEYEKAEEIINSKDNLKINPLKFCLETIQKRHIGEEHILLLLLASGVSVGFDNRKLLLHIMGVGSSGKGKTDSMGVTGQIFTGMYTITSASPKSIFYQSKDNKLPKKGILFYPENDNKEDFEALERVLTDDKEDTPSHNTVINGESVELSISQKCVFWRNSVGTSEDEDNQTNNRYYIYNVDESEEQDNKIYEHILDTWNYIGDEDKSDINIAKAITDIIKSEKKKIYIPYIKYIELNRKNDRRILKKFLKLLCSIVYFNRFQRINIGDFVIAYVDDFIIANYIWEKISKYESSKLSELDSVIVEVIATKNGVCPSDLSKIINKDVSNLSKKLKDMEEKGLLYSERESITTTDESNYNKRISITKKKYYSTKWCAFGFRLVPGYYQTSNDLERYFKALNLDIYDNCKLGFGRFGTKREGVLKKINEKIVKDFSTSLSLKIIPNHIYNNYNNIYIDNTDPISEELGLVVDSTKPLPNHNQTIPNLKKQGEEDE